MSDARRTRINTELTARGLSLTAAMDQHTLQELMSAVKVSGGRLSKAVDAVGTYDTFVLAPAASQTNTLTIKAAVVGHAQTTGIVTVAVADAGGDTLAVTYAAGVLAIALANTTDSKNTLTLIKAAIDAAVTSTTGAGLSCFITGTASTQMVHGGTNTLVAAAAGATAGTSLKSSTAGAAATGALSIAPA